jgi:hypothetical protein
MQVSTPFVRSNTVSELPLGESRRGTSFAIETTLRSTITFEQARLARQNGFRVVMVYVALDTVEHHIERVKRRASRGGHSASEVTLRRIHASSVENLPLALENVSKTAASRRGIRLRNLKFLHCGAPSTCNLLNPHCGA